MQSMKSFSWSKYLEKRRSQAAPERFFSEPFPYNKNGFRPGMKLEGIDPEHQSLFCVLTVAEVQGNFIDQYLHSSALFPTFVMDACRLPYSFAFWRLFGLAWFLGQRRFRKPLSLRLVRKERTEIAFSKKSRSDTSVQLGRLLETKWCRRRSSQSFLLDSIRGEAQYFLVQ